MFQILNCSDIGTCCSDYALANVLDVARRVFDFIQLIAPIALIIAATIQLATMVINPEQKAGLKKIFNKVLAAVIIFLVPVLFNISIGLFPDDFSIKSCWEQAKIIREITQETKQRYVSLEDKRPVTKIIDEGKYEKGTPVENPGGNTSVSSVGGKRMVDIAVKEIGNNSGDNSHHKYEAFNGLRDSAAWCAAFVTWVAGQAGYLDKGFFPRYVRCEPDYFRKLGAVEHREGDGYNPVAGDIIFFKNAVTITHTGIVISSDSKYVYTVEGNTNCEGEAASRCGRSYGVSKKSRVRPGNIWGYMTPKYPN